MIITSLWNRGKVTASGSNSPVDVLKKTMQLMNHFFIFGEKSGLVFPASAEKFWGRIFFRLKKLNQPFSLFYNA
jgi:hypothetical protein